VTRRTALLAGATGLVGGECLRLLLASDDYASVTVVTRRATGAAARHRKVREVIVDFAQLDSVAAELHADHVYCALGSTIRKAGSREAFRQADFEYPRRLARLARANGARYFALVSALGASTASPFFYSRVKGELEASLRAMDWPGLCLVRPSVIAGNRTESRPIERLSGQLLSWGPAAWRPVPATAIAAAMIATALRSPPGVTTIESADIWKAAAQGPSGPFRR
jgi:uncharacterized protein YbjT (DUF2867 family)